MRNSKPSLYKAEYEIHAIYEMQQFDVVDNTAIALLNKEQLHLFPLTVDEGIVPMFCEALFAKIRENEGKGTQYEVKFSMLEIYNEVVRDLLNRDAANAKKGLKVRENNNKGGFYGQ
jgi:hypothetical protein